MSNNYTNKQNPGTDALIRFLVGEMRTTENITMSKKENAAYWDEIDNTTEDFVNNLLTYGFDKNGNNTTKDSLTDSEIINFYKEILDFCIPYLEKHHGITFPYVDEDM